MLTPLGIYNLNEDSLVTYELTVYATELEKLHDKLRIMLRESFISTAEEYGIETFEKLFDRFRPDLPIKERKDRLRLYMTLDNNNFTVDDIRHQLRLVGISDNFVEIFEDEQIDFPDLVALTDIVKTAEQLNIIEDILPSNLHIDVGFREFDWDEFDSLDFNFGTIDRMGLRFDLFENQ